jgi:hypothetical protein
MWRAGLMDAVASRDEVETTVGIKFTGRLSVKLQVRTNTFCRGARAIECSFGSTGATMPNSAR